MSKSTEESRNSPRNQNGPTKNQNSVNDMKIALENLTQNTEMVKIKAMLKIDCCLITFSRASKFKCLIIAAFDFQR